MPDTSPLLEVRNLSRHFTIDGAVIKALDDVSLTLKERSIMGVVGESGSGKSTLAKLVMALDTPTSGQVFLDDLSLFDLTPAALRAKRRDFQMVFQDPYSSLNPRHTVESAIGESLYLLPDAPKGSARRDMIGAALEDVGLSAADVTRYPHEFSGGQRQRIAIARALLTKPRLLVADEATSALDLTVQKQILKLLLDLRDSYGVTILFITHNIGVVEEICDEVTVMQNGKIVERGLAHQVLGAPQQGYTQKLLAAEPTLEVIGRGRHRQGRSG